MILAAQWRIQEFPEEGAPSAKVGRQPRSIILANFPQNFLKKIWAQRGGERPFANVIPNSPIERHFWTPSCCYSYKKEMTENLNHNRFRSNERSSEAVRFSGNESHTTS